MVYRSLTGFQMTQWLHFSILDSIWKSFFGLLVWIPGLAWTSDNWCRDRTKYSSAIQTDHYASAQCALSCIVQNSRTCCKKKSLDQGTTKLEANRNVKENSNYRKQVNAFHSKDLWVCVPETKNCKNRFIYIYIYVCV